MRTLAMMMLLLVGLDGCGSEPCGGVAASEEATAPRITNLRLARQLESDPWTLILDVLFSDSDGDLSRGSVQFYLGDTKSQRAPSLDEIFADTGLADNATHGEFGVPVRFAETVRDGQSVRLGTRLLDGAQHASNCYERTQHFKVEEK